MISYSQLNNFQFGSGENTWLLYLFVGLLFLLIFCMIVIIVYYYYQYSSSSNDQEIDDTDTYIEDDTNVNNSEYVDNNSLDESYNDSGFTEEKNGVPNNSSLSNQQTQNQKGSTQTSLYTATCTKSGNNVCTLSCKKDSNGVQVIIRGPWNMPPKYWSEQSKSSVCGKIACKPTDLYCLNSCATRQNGTVVKTYKLNNTK